MVGDVGCGLLAEGRAVEELWGKLVLAVVVFVVGKIGRCWRGLRVSGGRTWEK